MIGPVLESCRKMNLYFIAQGTAFHATGTFRTKTRLALFGESRVAIFGLPAHTVGVGVLAGLTVFVGVAVFVAVLVAVVVRVAVAVFVTVAVVVRVGVLV